MGEMCQGLSLKLLFKLLPFKLKSFNCPENNRKIFLFSRGVVNLWKFSHLICCFVSIWTLLKVKCIKKRLFFFWEETATSSSYILDCSGHPCTLLSPKHACKLRGPAFTKSWIPLSPSSSLVYSRMQVFTPTKRNKLSGWLTGRIVHTRLP